MMRNNSMPGKHPAFIFVIMACMAVSAHAMDMDKVACFRDRNEYLQGDHVIITVRNNTQKDIDIVNRDVVDGGFATIERKRKNEKWEAIELIAAANILTFKTVKRDESHRYIWRTQGYNGPDTHALTGVYRITLYMGMQTNEFIIK